MADLSEILAAYGAAWRETDSVKRAALLDVCWADDAIYQDPTALVKGKIELSDHIGGAHDRFPGMQIELTTGVDSHHDCLRFGWCLRLADGSVAVEGIDFATLSADGRLASITGFFGPLPAA